MSALRYEQLNKPDREIRLLRVKPRDRDLESAHGEHEDEDGDILACQLLTVERGAECPKYTALSYAWGQRPMTKTISIDSVLCEVNETVEMALREIRWHAEFTNTTPGPERHERGSHDKGELVWVDQICINQADEVEKSHQVSQMRHIYCAADHVIAWLGPSWPDCEFLFGHLTKIGAALRAGDYDLVWESHRDTNIRRRLSRAYYDLCTKQYWTRLWVMQEYAVPKNLTVVCGRWRLDSRHIHTVIVPDEDDLPPLSEQAPSSHEKSVREVLRDFRPLYKNIPSSFVLRIITRRSGYQFAVAAQGEPRTALYTMLTSALVLEMDYNFPQTSDSRDRIFSLMGLTADRAAFQGFPDYTSTCERVYQTAVEGMLRQGRIDILAYCQFPKNLPQLPSWVPDWSMTLKAPSSDVVFGSEFQACGPLSTEGNVQINIHEVTLQGILVDTIRERSELCWSPNWLQRLDVVAAQGYIQEISRYCSRSPRIRKEDERDDIGRIAIAEARGQYSVIEWPQYYQLLGLGMEDVRDECSLGDKAPGDGMNESSPNHVTCDATALGVEQPGADGFEHTMLPYEQNWYRECLRRLPPRRPMLTTTGFVGLAPEHVEPGDQVFVLLGGTTPFVLRRMDGGNRYTLVGDAYVHGIMYGEMTKGEPEVVDVIIV